MLNNSATNSDTILFTALRSYALYASRLTLMKELQQKGFRVVAASTDDEYMDRLRQEGIIGQIVPYLRGNLNLLGDIDGIMALRQVIRQQKPSLIHCFQPKPLLFTALLSGLSTETKLVATITGLGKLHNQLTNQGSSFLTQYILSKALNRYQVIIFQNSDDQALFQTLKLLPQHKCRLVRSSGVDVDLFRIATPKTISETMGLPPRVLMAGRLLWSKGVREYIEAAQVCQIDHPKVRFDLAGEADETHQDAVPLAWIHQYKDIVTYVGYLQDMAQQLQATDIFVLPSYREGVPRVLLEAAACGVSVVTVDTPGCREAVVEGQTGRIVPAKDSQALAQAISELLVDPDLRQRMGQAGRQRVEAEFDVRIITNRYLDIYREIGIDI